LTVAEVDWAKVESGTNKLKTTKHAMPKAGRVLVKSGWPNLSLLARVEQRLGFRLQVSGFREVSGVRCEGS